MLPPIVRTLIALVVGIALGGTASYVYTKQLLEKEILEANEKLRKQDKIKLVKEEKTTNKILKEVRKSNEEHKDFECSDAKLPDGRVQRIQREIERARQRSNSSLLYRAIEKARNL